MLQKIIQYFSQYLFIPLILKGYEAFQEYLRKKKEAKDLKEKNAKAEKDFKSNPNNDTFNKLP